MGGFGTWLVPLWRLSLQEGLTHGVSHVDLADYTVLRCFASLGHVPCICTSSVCEQTAFPNCSASPGSSARESRGAGPGKTHCQKSVVKVDAKCQAMSDGHSARQGLPCVIACGTWVCSSLGLLCFVSYLWSFASTGVPLGRARHLACAALSIVSERRSYAQCFMC